MKGVLKKCLLWVIPCTMGQLSQVIKSEICLLAMMLIVCFCWMILYDLLQ